MPKGLKTPKTQVDALSPDISMMLRGRRLPINVEVKTQLSPQEVFVDALLAKWPHLWTELSLRDDVSPQGKLDPRWRALLVKYGDRFMVGTDTWTVGGTYTGNERWDAYAQIVGGIRAWLAQLPPDVAEAIAHGNAERFLAALPR